MRAGWFVLEPYIVPSLFQKYPTAVDEWTLSQAIANDTSSGGLQAVLEDHYNTFIVRVCDVHSAPAINFVADRGGLHSDRGRGPKLGSHSNTLLGD